MLRRIIWQDFIFSPFKIFYLCIQEQNQHGVAELRHTSGIIGMCAWSSSACRNIAANTAIIRWCVLWSQIKLCMQVLALWTRLSGFPLGGVFTDVSDDIWSVNWGKKALFVSSNFCSEDPTGVSELHACSPSWPCCANTCVILWWLPRVLVNLT